MAAKVFFPRRLYRWFVINQIFISSLLLFGLYGSILLWFELRAPEDLQANSLGRTLIAVTLFSAFLAMVLVSLVMARKLVIPLGRLIEKTSRLRKFPFETDEISGDELAYDEPGEWYDLEKALDRLGDDLRQKTIRLSREKTELRAIMGAMNEAILAVDQEHRPLFFNSQFALLFGRANESMADVRMTDILRDPEVLKAYREVLSEGTTRRMEVQLTLKDQLQPSFFQVSIAPLTKKHNQEIYGAAGIFYDITDLKRADRVRIEFVGNVSHELRTPLTSIKGYVQTLEQDFRNNRLESAGEFLSVVHKNVERLILLVNDLLDLSSLESGAELAKNLVNTRELTEAVVTHVNAKDHVIQMKFDVAEFNADSNRVEQVLTNLLQNAIRYVPKGKKIEIFWQEDPDGVRLRVKDNGPGIPKEHQNRLFERFYRIDEARSREVGGTGIGLSIVKHIMQRHGGSVKVISEPGHGAEFVCHFPQMD